MRRKDGGISQAIGRMMMVITMILAVLLSVKAVKAAGWGISGEKAGEWLYMEAERGLALLWRQSYPAANWEETGQTRARQKSSAGTFLCRLAFEWSPLYRSFKTGEEEEAAYEEADPAFAGFLARGKFYEEHSFLRHFGGEESGEDGSGGNAGEGSGKDGNGGNAAGERGGQESAVSFAASKEDLGTYSLRSLLPVIGTTYRKEQLADFDFLMKHFYSIHSSTTAGRDLIRAEEFLSRDFTLEGGNGSPKILIYHTHSQEEFADYGPDHPEATVVGLGNTLTRLLEEKGYNVLHDTSVYDFKNGKLDRNKAYTYALEGVTAILQKNPSIEVIIDLHRDGVKENLHMVQEVDGRPTAPIMFFNGVSQTPEGPIEYLPNSNREDNLAFSFQMQLDAAAYYPGLTRKIYIKGLRYNLHLRPRSTLIEAGAQTNTYEEVLNAMGPLAEVLDMVLQGN